MNQEESLSDLMSKSYVTLSTIYCLAGSRLDHQLRQWVLEFQSLSPAGWSGSLPRSEAMLSDISTILVTQTVVSLLGRADPGSCCRFTEVGRSVQGALSDSSSALGLED
jgi:hypothetical protein